MPRLDGPQFTFADFPYPRLREAYARGVVHHAGEARVELDKALKDTGIPLETFKQMAKSDGIEGSERSFNIIAQNPYNLYRNAHMGAALHAIRYKENEVPSEREKAKKELLFAFRNRHTYLKSPHFSSMVN